MADFDKVVDKLTETNKSLAALEAQGIADNGIKSITSNEARQSSFELANSKTPAFGLLLNTSFKVTPRPSSKFFAILFFRRIPQKTFPHK